MSDADDTIHAPQRLRVRQLAAAGIAPHSIRQLCCPQLDPPGFARLFAPELALGAAEADRAVAEALFELARSGKSVQVTLAWARQRLGWTSEDEAHLNDTNTDSAAGWGGLQTLMDEFAAAKAGSAQPAGAVDQAGPSKPAAAAG
mgnify:CR=1 FL=1